jgi:hypothetical protein
MSDRSSHGATESLSPAGRRRRGVATGAALVLLLLGTTVGEDDHFPFGPFRMYSISNDVDGRVTSLRVKGRVAGGPERVIPFAEFGLRRAELQGQVSRFYRDDWDQLLVHLVDAYRRFNPRGEGLTELRLLYEVNSLRDGRPVAYSEETLATWRAE